MQQTDLERRLRAELQNQTAQQHDGQMTFGSPMYVFPGEQQVRPMEDTNPVNPTISLAVHIPKPGLQPKPTNPPLPSPYYISADQPSTPWTDASQIPIPPSANSTPQSNPFLGIFNNPKPPPPNPENKGKGLSPNTEHRRQAKGRVVQGGLNMDGEVDTVFQSDPWRYSSLPEPKPQEQSDP